MVRMKEIEKKKILIVGNSAKEYALAKKFLDCPEVEKVFAAPGNQAMKEFAEVVDIREDNPAELLEFAMENAIDLTVVCSETAIKSDISTLFQTNGQMIFAPSAQSANIAISKSAGKKFFYKLHIPTPRFGIFEKQQLALDYVKNCNLPIVIRTDESSAKADRQVCSTAQSARIFVEDLFLSNEKKVLLEDYVYGHEFIYYVITDGYHVLPLSVCANYKFMLDGNGGLLTPGMGCFCPDYKLSKNVQFRLFGIVKQVLNSLERRGTPYLGILGIEGVLTSEDKFTVLEFKSFLQDHDAQAVLNLLNDNIYTLFQACAVGSFADDYEKLDLSEHSSVSCVLSSGKLSGSVIDGLDNIEDDVDVNHFNTVKNNYLEYVTTGGRAVVLTKTASTLSRARELLYDNIEVINFSGKKYRKDICSPVE